MKYDAVIFDFDGVLLDADKNSFKWANDVREQKARELGYEHDLEVLRALFEVEKSSEKMKKFLSKHEIDLEDLRTWEKEIEKEKIRLVKHGQLGLYPGARELLEELNVPKALISNAYGEATDEIVRDLGLDEHLGFWKAPSLDDIEAYVEQMKPHPDMILEAMEAMGVDEALMVGDSMSDVEAAENAGIDSVYIDRDGEKLEEATYNVETLEEVKEIVGVRPSQLPLSV